MLTLAFDTSTDIGSVALGSPERVIASSTCPTPGAHSETMLREIRDLLASSDVALADLGGVAVGSGPGSFTGLRVGAALAKGLCFALRLPLYAYSSLSAVVAGLEIDGNACAMTDARAGRVFAALYESSRPLRELGEPRVWGVQELIDELQPIEGWTVGGDGALRHADLLRSAGARLLPGELSRPRAEALLHLARERPDGRIENVGSWQPDYLLPSAAERLAARRPGRTVGDGGERSER